MSTYRLNSALALVLSIALGGCAVVPTADTDPTGEMRLMQMHAIHAQMQQILAQRQRGGIAPPAYGAFRAQPSFNSAAPLGPRPRCRSRETVCGNHDPRCMAEQAGIPYC
jgi:hypothetical protein